MNLTAFLTRKLSVLVLVLLSVCRLQAQDGSLNTSFGNSGKALGPSLGMNGQYPRVFALPGGYVLYVNTAVLSGGKREIVFIRYTPTGVPHTAFGNGGMVRTGVEAIFLDAARQPDGKIVVHTSDALYRFLPDGRLDAAFGSNGQAPMILATNAMALQPDGKILVAGQTGASPGSSDPAFGVARFRSDGTLDSDFGVNGLAAANVLADRHEDAYGVAVQPDGKILLGGIAENHRPDETGYQYDAAIARLLPNGEPDGTFDGDGKVIFENRAYEFNGGQVAVQQDGRILLNGQEGGLINTYRLNPNGSLDTEFGNGGMTHVQVRSGYGAAPFSLALQGDGKILIGGQVGAANENSDLFVLRLNAGGAPDPSFNYTGVASFDLGTNEIGGHLAIAHDQLLLAGLSYNNSNAYAAALVKLNNYGALAGSYTAVPARIQAEHWNKANGNIYHGYRDTAWGPDHYVQFFDANSWVEYNINVPAAGIYNLQFRTAGGGPGTSFEVVDPSRNVPATVQVPASEWITTSARMFLPAGRQTLRVVPGGSNTRWALDWLQFIPVQSSNKMPVVSAGRDTTITLPAHSVPLNGSAADQDGTIDFYSWSKVSGPAQLTLGPSFQPNTTVSNLVEGTYTFRLTAQDNQGTIAVDEVTVTVLPAPPDTGFVAIPATLQAEGFSNMYGVQLESTRDSGGGNNVGWIDYGDWMEYRISVPVAGTYHVSFRLAAQNSNAQFRVGSGGSTLATVNVPHTGGYQTWKTLTLPLTLPAGNQTVRLTSTGGAYWNINWLAFAADSTLNQAPSAHAGADTSIALPATAFQLTGMGTDKDGSIAAYKWSQVSGPAPATFSSTAISNPTVSNLVAGTYTFQLTVTDNRGASASDAVVLTVQPLSRPYLPIPAWLEAELYSNMSGVQTETTQDVFGNLNVTGIDHLDWMEYRIKAPAAGTYVMNFRIATNGHHGGLTVKDASGNAVGTQYLLIDLPNTGGLQTWQTVSMKVTLPAGEQTLRVENPYEETWNLNWLEVLPLTTNQPPSVNAGADQTITLPANTAQLGGAATDADGRIVSYKWTMQLGHSQATFSDANAASTMVGNLVEGHYFFRLTVTDNNGATAYDEVLVTVAASPDSKPYVPLPARIEAEDYSRMNGVWKEYTRDTSGVYNLVGVGPEDWMEYKINAPVAGTYTIHFRVATMTADAGLTVKDSAGNFIGTPVSVLRLPNTQDYQRWQTVPMKVVLPAGNQVIRVAGAQLPGEWASNFNLNWLQVLLDSAFNKAPVALAGEDRTLTLPASTVLLQGGGTDADGSIAAYKWSQVSGPAPATFSSNMVSSPTISNLVAGTYTFRLTVTDNSGATAADDVVVLVQPAPNRPPVANAGPDQTITLPVNWVQLNGSGSDPDGNILSYTWHQVLSYDPPSGPAAFSNNNTPNPTVTGLTQGAYYEFVLTVTDSSGLSATDVVIITVQPAPNQAPTANAGTDQTITLPAHSVQLNGSGADPDGSIAAYHWSQVSGPSAASFSNVHMANPTAGNLVQGTYTFRLRVTDNSGATALDEVVVKVNPAPVTDAEYVRIPARIEGEKWTVMSGVQNEATVDAGGGQNVGWIDYGDWMEYKISVPTFGTYSTSFRIATPNSNAQFQVRLGNTVLATVAVPNTGGFQTWQTHTVSLPLAAGNQTLRLVSTGGAYWNLNWLEFAAAQTANRPPTAHAGTDRELLLPENSLQLNGTSTDPDGDITTFQWIRVSGPSEAVFGNAAAAGTTVSGLVQGQYVFRLTVTDPKGATASDDLVVTVKPAPVQYVTVPARIEAEHYTSMSGVKTQATNDAGGGQEVTEMDQGDWVEFTIHVPAEGWYYIYYRAATPVPNPALELSSNGSRLMLVGLAHTGSYQVWATTTTWILLPAGMQTIRLTAAHPGFLSLNRLEIVPYSLPGYRNAQGRNDSVQLERGTAAVQVFPNPVRDHFTLKVDNGLKGQVQVQVAGANGAVLKTYALNKAAAGTQSYNLALQNLPKGVYTLQVQMRGWKAAQTIIKQ